MAIFICVVALAGIVAGCGSSDDDSTATPTKAEFKKQASAICEKGKERIDDELEAFVKKIGGPTVTPTEAEVSELASDIVVPAIKTEAERMRELGIPSGDEEEITAMLDAFDKGIEEGEANPEKVFASEGISAPFAKGAEIATKYGLEGCGQL
jgi:hypothetical protein